MFGGLSTKLRPLHGGSDGAYSLQNLSRIQTDGLNGSGVSSRIWLAAAGDNEQQVLTLLYCLGPEAEDVLLSTNITAEEKKVYETVMLKFDSFFHVRVNQTLERAKFNNRCQKEGETANEYITASWKPLQHTFLGQGALSICSSRCDRQAGFTLRTIPL